MNNKTYIPGQIVTLAGIEFVILDDLGATYDGDRWLFAVTLKSQVTSEFGDRNNYAASKLRDSVDVWLAQLGQKLDREYILPRTIDLTTLDGYKGFGSLKVDAAPLTLDEARKYADIIPNCGKACWLATGLGRPRQVGSTQVLYVQSNGSCNGIHCSVPVGVRPAIVFNSMLLDLPEKNMPDLAEVSTDDLLSELRRRMEDK